MYHWIITKDFIDAELKGIQGPYGTNLNEAEIRSNDLRRRFRMYDDDDNLCCEGFIVPDSDCSLFEPLDDYGHSFGAVKIKYFNKETGKLEIL